MTRIIDSPSCPACRRRRRRSRAPLSRAIRSPRRGISGGDRSPRSVSSADNRSRVVASSSTTSTVRPKRALPISGPPSSFVARSSSGSATARLAPPIGSCPVKVVPVPALRWRPTPRRLRLDEVLDDGQAEAEAAVRPGEALVGLAEALERVGQELARMPTPLSEMVTRICESTQSIRAGTRPRPRELDRVREQVPEHLAQRSASPFMRGGSLETVRSSAISLASAAGRRIHRVARAPKITTGCRRRRSRPVMTRDTSRTSKISCACDCALRPRCPAPSGCGPPRRAGRAAAISSRGSRSAACAARRQRGQELFLQPVGALGVVAGPLGVLARRLQRGQHVAQLVLPRRRRAARRGRC